MQHILTLESKSEIIKKKELTFNHTGRGSSVWLRYKISPSPPAINMSVCLHFPLQGYSTLLLMPKVV